MEDKELQVEIGVTINRDHEGVCIWKRNAFFYVSMAVASHDFARVDTYMDCGYDK